VATRILVIEDDEANMDLMVYLLGAFGYQLLLARNGREGVEIALREPVDLVICDLGMPEMNGYEMVRKLKARVDLRPTPLIAVTAYAMAGDRDQVLKAGFDGYITKPICPETFVQQIEGFLALQKVSDQAPTGCVEEGDSRPLPPAKSATILIVDDSPVNLSLLHSALAPSGYRVVSAETVQQGMAEIHRHTIDLILSDLHMPGKSGLEFLRMVKTDPRTESIPFVLFSASSSRFTDVSGRARSLGARLFFVPPIDPQRLLTMIGNILQEPQRD
jgi:two-component system cell cycle response regulator